MVSMLLSGKIASSETKYKNILEEFFREIFDISFLPSHGIDHHRRVWQYAKDVLYQLDDHGFQIEESLTDKLIITCFLHDVGMSVDPGFRHGAEGRKICERFLSQNKLFSEEYSDVLHAIEHHDDKEYTIINQPGDLLAILSAADDLDAFGFTGVYRYLEVYIARNTPLQELGYLIIENIQNRFQNFLRTYGFASGLVEKHTKRYSIVCSFFNSYNQHVPFYDFDSQLAIGYCGIAAIVMQKLIGDQSDRNIMSQFINYPDPVIQWFFAELKNEFEAKIS